MYSDEFIELANNEYIDYVNQHIDLVKKACADLGVPFVIAEKHDVSKFTDIEFSGYRDYYTIPRIMKTEPTMVGMMKTVL